MKLFSRLIAVLAIATLAVVSPLSICNIGNVAVAANINLPSFYTLHTPYISYGAHSISVPSTMQHPVVGKSGGRISGGDFGKEEKRKDSSRNSNRKRGVFNNSVRVASPDLSIIRSFTLFRVNFSMENQANIELKRATNREDGLLPSSEVEDYKEGLINFRNDRTKDSVVNFTNALRKNGDFAEAYVSRGMAYSKFANTENNQRLYYKRKAIDEFTKALKKPPKFAPDEQRYVEHLLGRGTVYVEIGDLEKALEDYSEAIKRNPDSYDAYFSRATVFSEKKRIDFAIKDLNNALDLNFDYPAAYLSRGLLRSRLNHYQEAVEDFEKVLGSNKKDAASYKSQAYLGRGIAVFKQGDESRAYSDFSTILRGTKSGATNRGLSTSQLDQDTYSRAYYYMGLTNDKRGDFSSAIRNYSSVISQKGPDVNKAYFNRGIDYTREKQYEKAISDLSKVIELAELNVLTAVFERAKSYLQVGDYRAAIKDFSTVIEENVSSVDAYLYRGIANFYSYKDEECYEDYKNALSLKPRSADIYRRLGDYYYASNLYEKAIESYASAASLKPNLSLAYTGASKAYLKNKNYPEALTQSTKAINTKGINSSPEAYYVRGISKMRLGNYAQAEIDLSQALYYFSFSKQDLSSVREIDTTYSDILVANGEVNFELRNYNESLQDLKGLKYNQQALDQYVNLPFLIGADYFYLNQYNKATQYLSDFVRKQPNSDTAYLAYYLIGTSNVETSDYTSAINAYKTSQRLKPTFVDSYVGQGKAYLRAKDYGKAIKTLSKAIGLKPKPEAFFLRGQAYYSRDDVKSYRNALDDFSQARELADSTLMPEINSWSARTNYKLGNYSDGAKDFEKVSQPGYLPKSSISSYQQSFFPLLYRKQDSTDPYSYFSIKVKSVGFSQDSKIIGYGSNSGGIHIRDAETGRILKDLSPHSGGIRSIVFHPKANIIAWVGTDTLIRLWDVSSGRFLQSIDCRQQQVYSLAFSPDGQKMACGGKSSNGGSITVLDIARDKVMFSMGKQRGVVRTVAFNSSGNLVASGTTRGEVKLWNAETGLWVATLNGLNRTVRTLAFSPDGMTLAAGGNDKVIQLWELNAGNHRLNVGSTVTSLSFSPNGQILAAGSTDNTIKLLENKNWNKIATLTAHQNNVQSVDFSPNGHRLLTGGDDGYINMWKIP